jgi:hypothetical protein
MTGSGCIKRRLDPQKFATSGSFDCPVILSYVIKNVHFYIVDQVFGDKGEIS